MLTDKQCIVHLYDMPVSEKLGKLRENSPFRDYTVKIAPTDTRSVTIHKNNTLLADKNIYYDLSHLNTIGMTLFTRQVCASLSNQLP